MDAESIIGALAVITIGGVLALSILHFGFHFEAAAVCASVPGDVDHGQHR